MTTSEPKRSARMFMLAGTPVYADATAILNPPGTLAVCWWLVSQRYPGLSRGKRMRITIAWAMAFALVYFAHSVGHIISAQRVGAPMSVLILNAAQWLNIYYENDVLPRQHMGRAAGGPAANLGLLVAAGLLRPLLPAGPYRRELVDVFIVCNLFVGGGALLPTPMFDGGALLKWSSYTRTGDHHAADVTVREAGMVAAGGVGILALAALIFRRWAVCIAAAVVCAVALADTLRGD